MRYPAAHKAETRERIVQAAARRFRARGTEGAVIGDLMRDLHLTHGGFYRHFSNKEELFVEAFTHLQERGRRVVSIIEQAPPARLKTLVDTDHRLRPLRATRRGLSGRRARLRAGASSARRARGAAACPDRACAPDRRVYLPGALALRRTRGQGAAAVLRHGRHADDGAGRGGRGATADAASTAPGSFSSRRSAADSFLAH